MIFTFAMRWKTVGLVPSFKNSVNFIKPHVVTLPGDSALEVLLLE
jgi:hypothetical protein